MTDCPFCDRIMNGEYDYDDKWTVSFEPLKPVTPGHRLFIPKRHVPDALTDPVVAASVMRYAAEWAGNWGRPCNLITSAGTDATQSVFHYHLHYVPRLKGDGLHLPWTGQAEREGRAT